MILGKNALNNYLVDVSISPNESVTSSIWGAQIEAIDHAVYAINQKVSLGNIVKPINLDEELRIYQAHPETYNPQFQYHFPDEEMIHQHKLILS